MKKLKQLYLSEDGSCWCVPLTKGKVALIDLDDYDKVCGYNWYFGSGYAVRRIRKQKIYYLHRIINNTPDDLHTDHINGNKLDNRKCNLRTCTCSENHCNRHKSINKSGHKGVYWDKNRNKWAAIIWIDHKTINLGRFSDKNEAIKVRKEAALKYHGEFANLSI